MWGFRNEPVIRDCVLHIIELKDTVTCRPKRPIQKERTLPRIKRFVGFSMLYQSLPNIFLMLNVEPICIANLILQVNAAITKIPALVAKETGSLLDRIRVSDTNTAGHVRDGEAFNCEPTVHGLSTDKNVGIVPAPIHLWRWTTPRINLMNLSSTYSVMKTAENGFQGGKLGSGNAKIVVRVSEIFNQVTAVWIISVQR